MKQIYIKPSLLALVAVATAGSVCAQSSVTMFGVVDASLTIGRGSGTGSANRTQLSSSGYNSSSFGIRGTEDIGGGLKASFWLEADVRNDDGSGAATNSNNQPSGASPVNLAGGQGLTFNRRSFVSLSGGWGELRLGRDYTPYFLSRTGFDPFGNLGVGVNLMTPSGITNGTTGVRASNGIHYLTPPSLGGFFGHGVYYLGENGSSAANSKDGTGAGVRVGYASGPLAVALATGYTKFLTGDLRQSNIGSSYDFGVVKIMGSYERQKLGAVEAHGFAFGGLIPVGVGVIRLGVTQFTVKPVGGTDRRARKLALGYVHNLSKRTALYTTFARVNNSGGSAAALGGAVTAPNSPSSGLDIGIRHIF
ncbi:MAG: porin [Ramlibacter sp.]